MRPFGVPVPALSLISLPSQKKNNASLFSRLADELKEHRSKVGDTSKSLAAMQVVSQASSDRLAAVEADLRTARFVP